MGGKSDSFFRHARYIKAEHPAHIDSSEKYVYQPIAKEHKYQFDIPFKR